MQTLVQEVRAQDVAEAGNPASERASAGAVLYARKPMGSGASRNAPDELSQQAGCEMDHRHVGVLRHRAIETTNDVFSSFGEHPGDQHWGLKTL